MYIFYMIVIFGSKLWEKLGSLFNIEFVEDQSNMTDGGSVVLSVIGPCISKTGGDQSNSIPSADHNKRKTSLGWNSTLLYSFSIKMTS